MSHFLRAQLITIFLKFLTV